MKFIIQFVFLFPTIAICQEGRLVQGKITDGIAAMENVNISIVGGSNYTVSDDKGEYELGGVKTGDTVLYTYIGMKDQAILIEDVTKILNISMVPKTNELDEVTVTGSRRRKGVSLEEEYATNEKVIRTAFGYYDADRASGNIRILTKDQIGSGNLCILDVLRGEFGGINVVGDCAKGGFVTIRGTSSINNPRTAIFDIDGQLSTTAPIWLSVNNIKRVAVLSNLATTTVYGSEGAGGVIVINTVSGNTARKKTSVRFGTNTNYASDKPLSLADVKKNEPKYLIDLSRSLTFKEAREIYDKYSFAYRNSPFFYLDSFSYFLRNWDKMGFANQIIEDNFNLFSKNPVVLKALAFEYEEKKMYEKANQIYRKVFVLRPNYPQSYFDLSNSYRDLNDPVKGTSIYLRYQNLIAQGIISVDSVNFLPIFEREYNNMLFLNKSEILKGKHAKTLYVEEHEYKGTRLLFEWNDGEAEFELGFVNPNNQLYTWKHTLEENPDLIYNEKKHGFSCAEYLIDNYLSGIWRINIKYLGNKSLTPTYLKVSIYKDFGTKFQSKKVRLFKLRIKNVNQELFALNKV